MRKLTIKITVILFSLLALMAICISILVLLLNNGKLTPLIEQQINKSYNLDISIGVIHFNVFSGITVNKINIRDIDKQKGFTLECNSLDIIYDVSKIYKGHVKNISLSNLSLKLDTEILAKSQKPTTSSENIPVFSIEEIFPKFIAIDNISISNTTIQIKSNDYMLATTGMNIQINDLKPDNPIDILLNGNMSASINLNSTPIDLTGEFDFKTKYNLPNDEIIFLDGSYAAIENIGKFLLNGKVVHALSNPAMNIDINSQGLKINDTLAFLKDLNLLDLSPIQLEGNCDLALTIQGNLEKLILKPSIVVKNFKVAYEDKIFKSEEFTFPAEVEICPLDLQGKITIESKFTMGKSQIWMKGRQIADLYLPITINAEWPNKITMSSGQFDGKILTFQSLPSIKELASNLKVDIDLKDNARMPFDVSLDTSISGPVHISGIYNYESGMVYDTKLVANNIDCSASSKKFVALIPEFYKDWSYEGKISVTTIVNPSQTTRNNELTANTEISLSDIAFSSPDYEYSAENINGNIVINTNAGPNFKKFSIHSNAELGPFFIMIGAFSADMKDNKTHLSLNGNYDTTKGLVSDIEGTMSLDNLGEIFIDGSVYDLKNNPNIDFNIKMSEFSNKGFFESFVKYNVEYSCPALFEAGIDGETSANFTVKGNKNSIDVDGNVIIEKSNLDYEDISVEDLNVNLPISISYPKSKTSIKKHNISSPEYGTVQIKKISCGPLEVNDIETNPIIKSNNFYIKDPLIIPIFDGTVDIKDFSVEDLMAPGRIINLTFQINNIDLEKATTTCNLTPFEGALDSSEISFLQEGNKFSSNGTMAINVFGGEIIISKLAVTNLFQSLMGIEFSSEIKHLDLGKLSNTYREWGSITGIMNGYIKDFSIVAGEPSSFDIEMKTDRKAKVKQVVSTKFLKNFVPGIGNILDKLGFADYKYVIMGLHAKLENDFITLRGAVREKGKELFMKGGGLKRLEIVFPNVDRRVPFKKFMSSFKGVLGTDFKDTQVQFK